MNDIERWLRRQAAREQRSVLLEEGLLGGRLWRYTWYRLRWFFVSYGIDTAVHAVTVLFLFRELRWGSFLPIVVAHAVTSLGSSFWWGVLEALRSRVRDLHRSGKPHRIGRVIAGWLVFALGLSAGLVAAALAWTVWHVADDGLAAQEAYIAVLLVGLAADLPVRCYHSGIYALRRVYKPMPAVLAPELVQLALTVALFPVMGLWALVVASAALSLLLTGVNLRYTGRVYHFIGVSPRADMGADAVRPALRGTGREAVQAGAANAVIALDSLVVLAVLGGADAGSAALVVLFLAVPGIRAGAEWARLFYFDLKKLELRLFTNLRRRFERHTARVAWALGLAFWALSVVVAGAVYEGRLRVPSVAMPAFFLGRSLLARAQVQAFADGAYGPVLATGVALVAGVAVGAVATSSDDVRLGVVAAVTVAAALVLGRWRHRALVRGEAGTALLTLDWLRRLGEVGGSVAVGSARLLPADGPDRLDARTREDQLRWRLQQLAERAARRLGERGAAAWIGPDRLVWFESGLGPGATRVDITWLQRTSGGLAGEVAVRHCANGEEALFAAARDGVLGSPSAHLREAVVPVDVEAARRRFLELVPDGVVYSPDEPVPPALAALPAAELRAILSDAVAFARDLQVRRRRSRSDVTALCAGGELRLVFVAGRRVDPKVRRRWRHHVSRLNVRAAIGGARSGSGAGAGAVRRREARRPRPVVDPALLDALGRVPLLAAVPAKELQRIAAVMTARSFAPGEAVTREGEAGVGFYVIAEGAAAVSVGGRRVRDLRAGDHFGEIALIAETPRTATVTATTELLCHRLTSWEFRRIVERNASIAWHVLRSTATLLHADSGVDVSPVPTD